ncbi:MAG TPA: hypothetical protein VH041_15825 [Caldimonas sp.]|nr:hypothetical protein [Caldimonas sp.]HEX4235762.1 hypothetical protein [Caldimonas sp.]
MPCDQHDGTASDAARGVGPQGCAGALERRRVEPDLLGAGGARQRDVWHVQALPYGLALEGRRQMADSD